MYRRGLWCLLALAVAACQGDQATRPSIGDPPPPSSAISDGAHSNGNPDFWFLPPMVPNPEGNPKYLDNGFNPNLTPEVEITAGATVILPRTPASLNGDHYHLNWKVPSSPTTLYRVTVWVGSSDIGFADLWTSANNAELKNVNTNEYVPLKDGRTLPIKFVIEKYALCRVPGEGPCASEVVSLAAGGTVEVTLPGTSTASGVSIPPQGSGPAPVITIEPCEDEGGPYDLNPRVTDLPVYGPCLTIISDPPTADLANAATVFVCDITPFLPTTMSAAQRERLTLLRSDPGAVTALPHTEHVCAPEVGAVGSLRGVLADLGDGRFRSAGRQLLAMLAPKPLYAALMLDVGAGGFTDEFSDFQFALPANIEITAGNNQTWDPGGTLPVNPKVRVVDLGGEPVEGARVRWDGSIAACASQAAGSGTETLADGYSTDVPWTIAEGANNRVACGRGLAGSDNNGPRASRDDPFQPIQDHFDGAGATPPGGPVPVLVQTGSVVFMATGVAEPVAPGLFDFGSGGWSSRSLAQSDPSPASWTSASFGPFAAGFTLPNGAPFRSAADHGCGNGRVTDFPPDRDLLLRKKFSLPAATDVEIRVAIDNDLIDVYLNGVKLNAATVVHEGCAVPGAGDNYVVVAMASAGTNTLAIRARDRGGEAFIDVKTSLPQYRVAGIGANAGNQAANVVFSSGDLSGTITRLGTAAFNALTPAQLRSSYDVLIITWLSDPALNVDWATRLEPFLALGGGIIYDGDPNNVADLTPLVTASALNVSATGITVTASVPGLTDGVTNSFVNNHVQFATFPTWDPRLSPFLAFTSGPDAGKTVGLYGRIGAGCIVLTGPDQDFHAVRGAGDPDGNQYRLLVNEIRFVRACP